MTTAKRHRTTPPAQHDDAGSLQTPLSRKPKCKPKKSPPGIRRVNLLLWALFTKTPLDKPIDEQAERDAARRVKMHWEKYVELKTAHPDLWAKHAAKRERAKKDGGWQPHPIQFIRNRKIDLPRKRKMQKERPRFTEWAGKKLLAQRKYKRKWLRHRVLDRLMTRMAGMGE